MGLSPEERKKIYEEEKTKAEVEKPKETSEASTAKELDPNIAGLLCYVGLWVTGIIFLILEKKNQVVRFHAMQSIVTFGALTIIAAIFAYIPFIGWFINWVIWVLVIVLWVVLMYKAYQGQKYKVPIAGTIAESLLKSSGTK